MQAALAIAALPADLVGPPLADQRLFDCVNCILSFQNADGGFATYELTRSYAWLEVNVPRLNETVLERFKGFAALFYDGCFPDVETE